MAQYLRWFDIGIYKSILWLVDSESVANKKIAEVHYDAETKNFIAFAFNNDKAVDARIDIETKTRAMEEGLAMAVASRFDMAGGTNEKTKQIPS